MAQLQVWEALNFSADTSITNLVINPSRQARVGLLYGHCSLCREGTLGRHVTTPPDC